MRGAGCNGAGGNLRLPGVLQACRPALVHSVGVVHVFHSQEPLHVWGHALSVALFGPSSPPLEEAREGVSLRSSVESLAELNAQTPLLNPHAIPGGTEAGLRLGEGQSLA